MRTTDSLERLERENRQLQDEIYERDRQREREADERERQREQDRRANHPSNRLYNGLVRDFREAVRLHIHLLEGERAFEEREFSEEERQQFGAPARWAEWIDTANRCLAEFDAAVGEAERQLAAKWQADEATKQFGDALAAHDYSGLAI